MGKNRQVIISAGGTGGHVFPAEALARDLIARGYNVMLATDKRGAKFENFADGVPTEVLASGGMVPGAVGKVKSIFSLIYGVFQSTALIKRVKPDVVIGFGGYPSFPPVYAAVKKKIPTIIHEQNAVLGKANAYFADKVDRIALSWPSMDQIDEADRMRCVYTGNPVRPEIAALYSQPYPNLDMDGNLRIFVMGGSLGAKVFADILPEAIRLLPEVYQARLHIVQQCRDENLEETRNAYKQTKANVELASFFKDVPQQLTRCHLFIGRSGASTVAEVTTSGRPAIFVPYPHHADQQQRRNAEHVENAGGAWVMSQDGFTAKALANKLETFLQNPQSLFDAAENARSCGRPDAARKLGNLVTALSSGWFADQRTDFQD